MKGIYYSCIVDKKKILLVFAKTPQFCRLEWLDFRPTAMLHITSSDAFSSAGTEGRFWTSETIHHCDAMQLLKSINALSQTHIQIVKRHPAIIHVSTSETPWSQARPAEDNWARNQRDGAGGKFFTTFSMQTEVNPPSYQRHRDQMVWYECEG